MTSENWNYIWASTGPVAVGLFKWWTSRKAALEKAALALRAQDSRQHSEVEVAERKLLPEMMTLYSTQLKELRQELRDTTEHFQKEMRETTSRMEREAMRMMNFIVVQVDAGNRMRNRLYLCDTIIHMHDHSWISHDFPELKIPSFKDPEPHS